MPINEVDFVARLKAGDQAAFSELYDRYGRAIYNVILEHTRSEPDAENLVQDTFVKIWRNIDRYDATKGRLFTWLVVIARRVSLDFTRSKYFLSKSKIQTEEKAVTMESPAPEMQQLEYLDLETETKKLAPNLKQIIDLQYFMGYTQQEVADETGLPLGTVKTRTRAALMFLRKNLEHV